MRVSRCVVLIALGLGTAQTSDAQQAAEDAQQADTPAFYAGAGAVKATVNDFLPNISATTWKALVGIRPYRWVGFEADYFATASTTVIHPLCMNCSVAKSEASAVSLDLVGRLPAGRYLDFFLKVGPDYYKLSVLGNYYANESKNGTSWGAGAGVLAHFGRVGVRLEYERLPADGTNSLEYVSLALVVGSM